MDSWLATVLGAADLLAVHGNRNGGDIGLRPEGGEFIEPVGILALEDTGEGRGMRGADTPRFQLLPSRVGGPFGHFHQGFRTRQDGAEHDDQQVREAVPHPASCAGIGQLVQHCQNLAGVDGDRFFTGKFVDERLQVG